MPRHCARAKPPCMTPRRCGCGRSPRPAARACDRLLDRRAAGAHRADRKLPAAVDRAPVLIAQHMPPIFTTVLAEHLSRVGGRGAHEAEDGEPVLAGGIYVAPGGRHMRVARDGDAIRDRTGRRSADQFLQAGGGCRCSVRRRRVWGAGVAGARSHRHGHRR